MSETPFYDQIAAEFDAAEFTERAPDMADHRAPDEDDSSTTERAPVNPKVIAAGISAGSAAAAVVILVWILGMFGVDVPPNVESALTTLIPGVAAGVGGWIKRGPA